MIINTIKDLKENLELIKYQNKKVGAISGAFDILHQGHIQTLDHCLKRVDNLSCHHVGKPVSANY